MRPPKKTGENNVQPKPTYQQYSSYFETIYEERNEHSVVYSVMRAPYNGDIEEKGSTFNFIVHWNEYPYDHKRVIVELEKLYLQKKLLHYIIVLKRKGSFYALLKPSQALNEKSALEYIDTEDGDAWGSTVIKFDDWSRAASAAYSPSFAEARIDFKTFDPLIRKWNLGLISSAEQDLNGLTDALASYLNISDPLPRKIVKHVMPTIGRRSVSMYGFQDKNVGLEKEKFWLKSVSHKFFRIGKPLKPGKLSHTIYGAIMQQINGNPIPFQIDGMCRRSFIIALAKILSEQGKISTLRFQIGPTLIIFNESSEISKKRQKGNFRMDVDAIFPVKYGDGCAKRINFILKESYKSKKPDQFKLRHDNLLEMFKARLLQMIPFTQSDFNTWGNIKIENEEEASEDNKKAQDSAHFLNALIMLITVVEVLVRLYRTPQGQVFNYADPSGIESDNFPVAIAQARSLFLLIQGKISFVDFIGQSKRDGYNDVQHRAYYGAVTGEKTMDNIRMMFEKLMAINEAFDAHHSQYPFWSEFRASFLAKNEDGCLIPGRTHIADDLRFAYGSGDESNEDSSDYSDSLEFAPHELMTLAETERFSKK